MIVINNIKKFQEELSLIIIENISIKQQYNVDAYKNNSNLSQLVFYIRYLGTEKLS